MPRTGIDPFTHQAYPDRAGTSVTENNWLRSWTHTLYLWYAEVPDQDPALFTAERPQPRRHLQAHVAVRHGAGQPPDIGDGAGDRAPFEHGEESVGAGDFGIHGGQVLSA